MTTFDAFISYSHSDKTTADATCAALEAAGVRCWIAPRDIVPGVDWGEAIIDAITGAKIMVLIFSGNANVSPQIKREVERAVSKAIPIIPLRIENVGMSKSLEYFLSTPHWLDALSPPLEKHLQRLTEAVRGLLKMYAEKSGDGEIKQAAVIQPKVSTRPPPTTSDAFYNRGLGYYTRREYDRAIQDFDEAIRRNPKYANAFCNRGAAYQTKREYDRAIADYDEAIRLNPKDADTLALRATKYQFKGQYDRAIQDFDEAIRLNPKFATAVCNRGSAYQSKGEYDRAIADYDEAIRLDPKYANAFTNRGIAWQNKSEPDRAIADYDEAIRLNPKDANALFQRGVIKRGMHDDVGADADMEAAKAIDPDIGL
jgi:tetratricopeptide (TPR) repeat protein